MKLSVSDLKKLLHCVFQKKGLTAKEAEIMAETVLDAELKGKAAQGLALVPNYLVVSQ